MKRNSNLVTFGGSPVTLKGKLVKPGQTAKNFIATGIDLKPFSLSDLQGKVRIISSVPSLDMGVCATQTRRFNKEATKLGNVEIITISCDLPFAVKRFCAAESIDKVLMVSDHKDADFGIKYGFLIEELRLLARGVIVIDKDDTVCYVELVKEIAHEPDYEKAFEAVRELV